MRDQTDERAEGKVGTAAEPGKNDAAGRSGEDSTAPGPVPVSAPEPPADLPAAYRKLLAEKADLYDRLLRKQAELENTRKRLQREKEDFLQHATADLIRALLPVLDAFERALKHRDANVTEEFYQGVELIYRNLLEVLGRAGLAPIETAAQLFDPHLHQAVETVEAPGHRDQEIVEELQRGYRLRHRLLRPAIVKVAVARKRSSGSSAEDQESGP
jgi:molecular chaperone GrpE